MKIIKKLYNVCSELRKTDSSEKIRDFKGSKYLALKEKLTPELGEELDSLVTEMMFSNLDELERTFKEGFCMGAELMLEIKSTDIKKRLLFLTTKRNGFPSPFC